MCDELINAADSLLTNTIPTNMTNTMSTNITCTVSTNSDDKNARYKIIDCYILHSVLLVIVSLLLTDIVCFHYIKQKRIAGGLTI